MIFKEIYGNSYREKISVKNDGKSILLCNYRIELTPSEYALVALLLNKKDWVDRAEISRELTIKESSIPVHVANTNKKAEFVSGRKLLVGSRNGEYRIAENV